jgi:hypothetical protein
MQVFGSGPVTSGAFGLCALGTRAAQKTRCHFSGQVKNCPKIPLLYEAHKVTPTCQVKNQALSQDDVQALLSGYKLNDHRLKGGGFELRLKVDGLRLNRLRKNS